MQKPFGKIQICSPAFQKFPWLSRACAARKRHSARYVTRANRNYVEYHEMLRSTVSARGNTKQAVRGSDAHRSSHQSAPGDKVYEGEQPRETIKAKIFSEGGSTPGKIVADETERHGETGDKLRKMAKNDAAGRQQWYWSQRWDLNGWRCVEWLRKRKHTRRRNYEHEGSFICVRSERWTPSIPEEAIISKLDDV